MEGIHAVCLIHGPGWLIFRNYDDRGPICKTGRKRRKARLIWPCVYMYKIYINIYLILEYFDGNNLNLPGLTSGRKFKHFYLNVCTICLDICIHLLAK